MKLLRSLLFVVLALMVISALAAPGFIGPKVEEIWKQQLGRLQGGNSTGYKRGWFGAETNTEVALPDGTTQLSTEIHHGPVLLTSKGPRLGVVYTETRLELDQLQPELRAQLESIYGALQASPVVLETLVTADNRVLNTLRLEPFKNTGSFGELEFGGGEIAVSTDYSGAVLNGIVELGSLRQIRDGIEVLFTEPLKGEFEYTPGEGGSAELRLSLLRTESDSGPVQLRDVTLDLNLEELAAQTLKIVSDLQLPTVDSATPITSVRQQMTLPRIKTADLGHYLRVLLPAPERNWAREMSRPLRLEQQLAIQSRNGPVLVDADIDWRGMRKSSRQGASEINQWLKPLKGSMTLSAAEQALLQSPLVGQTMLLRDYGLLIEDNGELQMYLKVNRGQLEVNGEQLPADLFVMALTGKF
ncbi:hypothetical protein BTJ40_01985 [Microbulbifer sp. A4B17]|uniref:DUF945 family protein n=1 Tax=Microbulbifer sp. A4B17 TaxID=359370 RepID=UPI000D52B4CC|nr:DUF945 family protein [Microbulbifer sp. A4B17]AWF79696.1 hypothetical protein BTJ40_01985 [Microbulbifer sp. A4B17]